MKRSQIQDALVWAKQLLHGLNFSLPVFADWTLNDWRKKSG